LYQEKSGNPVKTTQNIKARDSTQNRFNNFFRLVGVPESAENCSKQLWKIGAENFYSNDPSNYEMLSHRDTLVTGGYFGTTAAKNIFKLFVEPFRVADGLFSNQKSKFGKMWEGLAMEDVGIFYGHLVHFTVFCYILWTFGIVRGNLVYFSTF
jgi:hypothetical protein